MSRDITGTRPWVMLLGLASGLSPFGMASMLPALPALGSALEIEYGSLQFIVSAYLFGLGLAQPVQGLLCDRFGRRPALLAGFTLFTLASVAAALASSLTVLIACRVLQAMGVSVGTVAARAMVRDTHEPERAAIALSIITAVMGVSPIVAPIAGGAVTDLWGWRSIFYMHAFVAVFVLAGVVYWLRETRPADATPMTWPGLLRGCGKLVRQPVFLGYTMIYGFSNGGSFAFLTVGAAVFADLFDVQAVEFGLLWASLVVSYMLGAGGAAPLARRWGLKRTMDIGIVLTLVGGAGFVAAALWPQPSLIAFMIALSVFTLANGVTAPLSLAGAVSGKAEIAGIAAGLSSSLAMLTCMAFAWISGAIYDGTARGSAILLGIASVLTWVAARAAMGTRSARAGKVL